MFRKFLTQILVAAFVCSCSTNLDNTLHKWKGFVKVNDNGAIEEGFCFVWEALTGHKLGKTLDEMIESEDIDLELIVIMLQNYVEKAHLMGATRKQAIEKILVCAGYDESDDGKIRIVKDIKESVKKRLRERELKQQGYRDIKS